MKIKILTVFAVLLFSALGVAALERRPVLRGGILIDARPPAARPRAQTTGTTGTTDTTDIRNARTNHAVMQAGVAMAMPM